MLASPAPDYQSPKHHRDECEAAARWSRAPWVIDGVLVEIDDVDAHYARARDVGGATPVGIQDEPFGHLYRVQDIEGHRWMFIQPV
jgi:uncharacterized glyoxalase superfamily protein PhnB